MSTRSKRRGAERNGRTYTDGDEGDGLVDATERRNVDGLTTDGTLGTDTGRVFAGSGVDDGVDEDLDRVLVREEVDDLERVRDDADGHLLLTVVASVHHETFFRSPDSQGSRQFVLFRRQEGG